MPPYWERLVIVCQRLVRTDQAELKPAVRLGMREGNASVINRRARVENLNADNPPQMATGCYPGPSSLPCGEGAKSDPAFTAQERRNLLAVLVIACQKLVRTRQAELEPTVQGRGLECGEGNAPPLCRRWTRV